MRPIRPTLAAASIAVALALTATGCGGSENSAGGGAELPTGLPTDAAGIPIPDDLKNRLKEHGLDIDAWRNGEWKNWDRDTWLREARDYINPIIEGLWDPDRMRDAEKPEQPTDNDISGDQGVTDPTPRRIEARPVKAPYRTSAPTAGKIFFDGPKGSMVCSATVVKDPANPGRSNLVWTAGHCVHAGSKGGWYRNIAFVPSYNDQAKPTARLESTPKAEVAPHGVWWGDWAQTSDQWIKEGATSGGRGAPYDFAVIHVTPEKGGTGKSLEETVGSAVDVDFDAPATPEIARMEATGYPAGPPFDGQRLFQCADRPGRLSVKADQPTMHRIGCTMTAGSSGGGWLTEGAGGKRVLVSNTSIGPVSGGWLAGPRLGKEAKGVYQAVSKKFAGR
ncbi:trypsin-like serine peptidase [Streptomyces sp. NPDC094448]|uniref:trypsin-like serine peptidase n=1 Tax=Streptomyces sp. NPDC094448 TaxID=3366063 RepID=UPI003819A06F